MRVHGAESSSLGESARRVAAMAVVFSCHLGLLMLLLRPGSYDRDTTPVVENDPLVLKLRFIQQPQPPSMNQALPAPRPIALPPRIHGPLSGRAPEPPPAQRVTRVVAPPLEMHLTGTPTTPNQYTDNLASSSDGGFQERLTNAQHSYAVHGVPGSDMPSVPGIHLINPMSQGIGAVVRDTQRLFGVTNRHCVDTDVWRHLTPQELSARHISLRDVDKIDEKYNCNSPLGLSL